MTVLLINAGLGGRAGNSQVVVDACASWLRGADVPSRELVLAEVELEAVHSALDGAAAFVFVTGTYWGSCSSLLQRLFEELTETEGGPLWLGKPCAVLVTAHQVGAQTVLARLQSVLVALGCLLPPMSGVVVTKVGEALRAHAPELCLDVWGLDDVEVALENVRRCLAVERDFAAWPVDSKNFRERWLTR